MNLIESIAAVLAVILGSVVQAISGVGGGFIIVPLLAWIDLSLVPGPVVFGSIALSTIMAWRERQHIDLANVPMILIGLLPGCIAGAYLLTRVAGEQLGVVFGSVILLAVIISATGLKVSLNRFSALTAGLLSGAMGTSSGIGAPVLALLYQNQSGSKLRATLALIYTLATMIIIASLYWFGKFSAGDAKAGALLMPGYIIGYLLARSLKLPVDRGVTRIVVLGVSAAAALWLLVSSFL